MYPSDYGRLIMALAELMKEQNAWTTEAAFFARYFCKAAGIRATLPAVQATIVDVAPRNKDKDNDRTTI
jgi:hypothetical protein